MYLDYGISVFLYSLHEVVNDFGHDVIWNRRIVETER